MWLKFGKKKLFFWELFLVQVPKFGTGTKYGLESLHQCGKRVKTSKGWEKGFLLTPILNSVTNFYLPTEFHSHSLKSMSLDKMDRILQYTTAIFYPFYPFYFIYFIYSIHLNSNKIINFVEWVKIESFFITKNF